MKKTPVSTQNWSYLSHLSVNYFGWVFCWTIATTYMVPNVLLRLVDNSVKNTRLGLMSGAANIMVIILIPLIGSLSDHTRSNLGRRRPYYLLAAFAVSLLLVLVVGCSQYIYLLVLLVLMHAGLALWFTNRALVRDIVPLERRGRISGLTTITNTLGMMAGHVAAATLIEAGRLLLLALIAGAINIASNLWVALKIKEPPPAEPATRRRASWREIYLPKLEGASGLGWLAGSNLLTQMGMVAMVCFLLYFIKDQIDSEHFNSTFRNLVLIAMTAAIPSSFGAGMIADRFGRKHMLLMACLLQLASIVNFLVSPRVHSTLYVSGLLYGLGNGAYLSMYWTMVSDMVPEADTSKYIGLMQYTFLIPWAIIPPTLGPVVDTFGTSSGVGYNLLFIAIAFLLIAGMLLIPKIPETLKKAVPISATEF